MIKKIILSILGFVLFTISTMQAQEKNDIDNNHEHVATEKAIYTCSMHPEVKSDKPGECPKCGMKLIKIKEDQDKIAKTYTCSMHPEVKSDKPGECPKCGMKLIKMKEDQDKMAKTYTCSMHPEVKSDKPGECPKCGMKLVEKKVDKKKGEDHKMHKNKKHNH